MRKKWSGRSREQTPSRREKTSQLELAAYENVKYRVCMGVEENRVLWMRPYVELSAYKSEVALGQLSLYM